MVMEQRDNNRSLSGDDNRSSGRSMSHYSPSFEVWSAFHNTSSRSVNTTTASTISDPGDSKGMNLSMGVSTVASKPKEESLYETLLRYHIEQQGGPGPPGAAAEMSPPRRKNAPLVSGKSCDDEEDKKPAAIPLVLEGKPRKPLAMPYSRHHTAPKQSPKSQSPSQSPSRKQTRPRRGDVDSDSVGSTEQPRFLRRESVPERGPDALEKQSSFYRSLMEAAGQIPQPSPLSAPETTSKQTQESNDIDYDLQAERLQLELSRQENDVQSRKDEELARQLQRQIALEEEESANRDAALALRLQQEQMPQQPEPEESTLHDAMLALELSRMQTIQNNEQVVPEQVQILEQIRTENERKQIERQVQREKEAQTPNNDFVLSQQLAMNEWSSYQDIRHMPPGGAPFIPPGLQSSASWCVDGNVTPRDRSAQQYRRQQSHTSLSLSPPQHETALRRTYSSSHDRRRSDQQRVVHFVDERSNRAGRLSPNRPGRASPNRRQSAPLRSLSSSPQPPQPPAVEPTDESLRRGNRETRMAMSSGASHVIKCQGCSVRLHAPLSYSLVFCPNCRTVSPGQTVAPSRPRSTGRSGSRRNVR